MVKFPKRFLPFSTLICLALYDWEPVTPLHSQALQPEIISGFSDATCLEETEPGDPNPGPGALGHSETRKSEMGKEDWKSIVFLGWRVQLGGVSTPAPASSCVRFLSVKPKQTVTCQKKNQVTAGSDCCVEGKAAQSLNRSRNFLDCFGERVGVSVEYCRGMGS